VNPVSSTARVLVIVTAALLAACGGGGSADPASNSNQNPPVNPPVNTPTTPSGPSLVLESPTVTMNATTVQVAATYVVQLSLENLVLGDHVFVGGSYSTNGVQVSTLAVAGSQVLITLGFKPPYQMAVGTYQDTLTVRACRESPCVNHIEGSPKTIQITYNVTAPSGPPTLSLQQGSLPAEAFVLDATAATPPYVDVAISNMRPDVAPFVFVSSTSNAVAGTSYSPATMPGLGGRATIELKAPATLGAGTFTNTLTVRACVDAQCTNELAGSPASISIPYTIRNTITGPGYRMRGIPVVAKDLVWDGTRNVFYVSIPAASPTNPNTIGVFDPVSGTFTSFVATGNDPARLELSPDGQYLFVALRGVGEIKRLALPSLALDLTIPVGKDAVSNFQLYGWEMHVSPLSPHVLAVVRDHGQPATDIAVFDDAVMRPQTAGVFATIQFSSFQWDGGSRLFAVDTQTTRSSVAQIGVGPTGLQITASQAIDFPMFLHGGEARLLNGRMYTTVGVVFDPLSFANLGRIPVSMGTGLGMALDPAQGKVFFATPSEVTSFNANTYVQLETIPAPPKSAPLVLATRLVRWGYDGLALLNHQAFAAQPAPGIVLIDGAFVKP
jgi:hypothetical protein